MFYYHSDFKKEELRSAAVKFRVYLCSTADFKCIKLKEEIERSLHIFEQDWNCGEKYFVHPSSMKKEIDRKSHPFTFDLRYTIRALLTGSSFCIQQTQWGNLFLKQFFCSSHINN